MSGENKKNATERLTDLEANQATLAQALQPLELLVREVNDLKQALKLLNNKIDAVARATNEGGEITEERLSQFMIENNVKVLTEKVTEMVTSGLLSPSDTVGKESFVVINEADPSGKIVNPRMQFLLSALQNEEVRAKLEGAKVGDNVPVGDKGASVNVMETYDIVPPKASEAQTSDTNTTSETASADQAAAADAADTQSSASDTQSTDTVATA